MAHNSRRKEIIFMGKIRWIRACALLIMTAAIITACGRGNGNNMTTAPDTGSAGAGTTMERQTNGTNQSTNAPSQTAGESGGVLRVWWMHVADGIHNLTWTMSPASSGTTRRERTALLGRPPRQTKYPDRNPGLPGNETQHGRKSRKDRTAGK